MKKKILLFMLMLLPTLMLQAQTRDAKEPPKASKFVAPFTKSEAYSVNPAKGVGSEALICFHQDFYHFNLNDPACIISYGRNYGGGWIRSAAYFDNAYYVLTDWTPSTLVKVDPETGEPTFIADGLPYGYIAVHPDGNAYGISYSGDGKLYSVDVTTGSYDEVATLSEDHILLGFTFDINGRMFAIDETVNGISEFDITTGELISSISLDSEMDVYSGMQDISIDFLGNEIYWAAYLNDGTHPLFKVDFDSEMFELIGTFNSDLASGFAINTPFPNDPVAPTNFTATTDTDDALIVDLAWTNPTTTVGGDALSNFSIVLTRNGEVIKEFASAQAGANMTYTDDDILTSGVYNYSVKAVNADAQGGSASVSVTAGSICTYTVECTDSWGDGWNGNALIFTNANDTELARATITSGNSATFDIPLPSGDINLVWEGSAYTNECSFVVKDSNGEELFSYESPSEGVLYTWTNTCGGSDICISPIDFAVSDVSFTGATISWTEQNEATSWIIKYKGSDDEEFTTVETTSNPYKLSGLTYGTRYDVRVRALCDETSASDWAAAEFITLTEVIYVTENGAGEKTGLSWQNATNDLNFAIATAKAMRDTYGTSTNVWVAAGTYYGDVDSENAFTMKDGVNVYGGFAGNEPADYDLSKRNFEANATILDGQEARRVLYQEQEFAETTVWDGFTIQNGSAWDGAGACLRSNGSLVNCTVLNNINGSGIYADNATITNCVISDNDGRGISANSTTITNCEVSRNNDGGVAANSNTIMINCLISDNTSDGDGGGIYTDWGSTHINCNIVNNTSNRNGGGICNWGGATYTNCIVWGNKAAGENNNIDRSWNGTYNYCAIEGSFDGTNTSSIILASENDGDDATLNYVRFVGSETGDFRLWDNSACVNAGDNYASINDNTTVGDLATDLAGNARVYDEIVDMGAYEYNGEVYCVEPVVSVSNIQGTSALVSWIDNNRGELDNYIFEYAEIDATTWESIQTNEKQMFINNLSAETLYKVRVTAVRTATSCTLTSKEVEFETGCMFGYDEVVIGETTTGDWSVYLPIYAQGLYSHSQQIFLASELGNKDRSIDQISFQYYYHTELTRNIDIYLGHTDISYFENETFVPSTELSKVYSGEVIFNNAGENYWFTIVFDDAFEYNGVDNLVIAIDDNTGRNDGWTDRFYTHPTNESQHICFASDEDLELDNYSGFLATNSLYRRSNIKFPEHCVNDACPSSNIAVSDITDTKAVVSYIAATDDVECEIEYKRVADETYTPVTVTESPIELTGLISGTDYEVRIRTICAENSTSEWNSVFFTTPIEVIYVKADGAEDGDGLSWTTAFADLNLAVETAYTIGQQADKTPAVWVAAGTYYGNVEAENALTMKDGVNVYGGFTGTETSDFDLDLRDIEANVTILDGKDARRVLYQEYDFTNMTTWDGFTIQNGNSGDGAGAYLRPNGALVNCVVTNNTSNEAGGGVFAYGYGNACANIILLNCIFSDNSASNSGGGIFARIHNNDRYVSITNCEFLNNECNNDGGGVFAESATISDCKVLNNISGWGGGICASATNIFNCIISENNSNDRGGGVYTSNSTFVNCNVVNNDGGGVYCDWTNTFTNCIVWGNKRINETNEEAMNINGGTFNYCAIETDEYNVNTDFGDTNIRLASENNGIDSNINYVRFVNEEEGDYRLIQNSACVNTGDNAAVKDIATDLAGNARIYNETVDMGAYEYSGEVYCIAPIVSITNVTGTTALVNVIDFNTVPSDNYVVEYAQADATEPEKSITTTEAQIFINDLTKETLYKVWAKAVRAADECVAYSDTVYFTTGCYVGHDEIVIGKTTENANGNNLPLNYEYNLENYSYSQQIYLATELGGEELLIDQISFQYFGENEISRDIDVYLGNTDKASFESVDDYISGDNLTQVYSGQVIFNNKEADNWVTIVFDRIFVYDGVNNLVVAVDDNTGNGHGYGSVFYTHEATNSSVFYVTLSNSTLDNPRENEWYSGHLSRRNNIKFPEYCNNDVCPSPNMIISDVTDTQATILYVAPTSNATCEIEYKRSDEGEADYKPLTLIPDANSYTLTGLTFNTDYDIRIKASGNDCDGDWIYQKFTTLYPYMEVVYVDVNGAVDNIGSSWEDATNDLNWAVEAAYMISNQYGIDAQVWVAAGTYYGDVASDNAFTMWDGVNVYGGFAGTETSLSQRDFRTNVTILDGQETRRVLFQEKEFAEMAAWDGFTIQNGSAWEGAGARLYANGSLVNCIISNNNANYGGGVYTTGGSMINCSVANNIADCGGGIYVESGYHSIFVNCDIVCNNANDRGGIAGDWCLVTNCIIWGNKVGKESSNISGGNFEYCAIEGGYNGTGNINLASENDGNNSYLNYVRFVSIEEGDYRLWDNSACVNTGDNSVVTTATDLAGNTRIYEETVDMGAYEYVGEAYCVKPILSVSDVTGTSALLSWIDNNRELPDNYTVEYVKVGEETWTSLIVNEKQKFINNLAPETSYKVKVTSVREAIDCIMSSDEVEFTTGCLVWHDEIVIGETEDANWGDWFPFNNACNYSYTQQIYLAEELGGMSMRIDQISFQYINENDITRNIDVYLGNTNKDRFENVEDCIPVENLTKVYSGDVTFNNDGEDYWVTIYFSNSFVYNGTDNLVVAVYSGSMSGEGSRFYTHRAPNNNSSICYGSESNYGPDEMPISANNKGIDSYRNNIKFPELCDNTACPPSSIFVSDVTGSQATITYATPTGNEDVVIEYKSSEDAVYTAVTPTENPFLLEGLTSGTNYEIRITTDCGEGNYSIPTTKTFTTPVEVIYVKEGGTGNGYSWANAMGDLQNAVDSAFAMGTRYAVTPVVWVAAGTYMGDGTSENAFTMKNGVSVYGGFVGTEIFSRDFDLDSRDLENNVTILDGQEAQRVLYQESNFTNMAIWDGFTIQNGVTGNIWEGAGAYLRSNSALVNCVVSNNKAESNGGGIYAGMAILSNCVISGNTSNGYGGGVCANAVTMTNCEVSGNTSSSYGGGIYVDNTTMTDCVVSDNISNYSRGGGVYADNTTITNCIVSNNTSYDAGGGVYAYNTTITGGDVSNNTSSNSYGGGIAADNVTITGCVISGNESNANGGGIDANYTTITDCVISGNTSNENGGGVYANNTVTMTNCEVSGNVSNSNGGGVYARENTTIIGGEISGNVVKFIDDEYHYDRSYGGGVFAENATITDCVISDNTSVNYGGGVYVWNNVTMTGCEVLNNVSSVNGGGVFVRENATMTDCEISGNTINFTSIYDDNSIYGGGIHANNATMTNCIVSDNTINCTGSEGSRNYIYGAGVYAYNTSMTNCDVSGNTISGEGDYIYSYGGGIYAGEYVTMTDCVVSDNTGNVEGTVETYSYGGGVYTNYRATMTNCLISDNSSFYGGGVYVGREAKFVNCDIVNNTASIEGGGIYSNTCDENTFTNCVVWGNKKVVETVEEINNIYNGCNITFTYCAIEGGYSGRKNIRLASENDGTDETLKYPCFTDPENGDYTYSAFSPLANVGNNDAKINFYDNTTIGDITSDLAGNTRIFDNTVDMGAYELQILIIEKVAEVCQGYAYTDPDYGFIITEEETAEAGEFVFKRMSEDGNTGVILTLTVYSTSPITGLRAEPSMDEVTLLWDAPEGGANATYNVYRNGTQLGSSISGTTYTDETVETGVLYDYCVEAVFGDLCTSDQACITDVTAGCMPIENLAGVTTTNSVTLTWDAPDGSDDETTYDVYREGTKLGTASSTTYTDQTAAMGTTYNYSVVAIYGNGCVSEPVYSAPLTTECLPVATLTGTTTINSVTLTWTAPEGGENATYEVYRDGVEIADLLAGTTSYTDDGLLMGKKYSYVVKSVFPNCDASEDGEFITECLPVTNLAGSMNTTSITLTWTAPAGGVNLTYNIYDGVDLIANVDETEYTVTGLEMGTAYNYCVEAVYPDRVSTSVCDRFVTECLPVANIGTGDITTYSIELTWTAPARVENLTYNIYRDGSTVPLNDTPITETTYTDNDGLMMGTSYNYCIVTIYPDAVSAPTCDDFGTACLPVEHLSGAMATNSIALSWTIPTGGDHATYVVYRDGVEIDELSEGRTSFTDDALAMGTRYHYEVKSVFPDCEASDSDYFTTICLPVEDLSGVESYNSIELSWNMPEGGDDATYVVYRDGVEIAILSAGTTSFTDDGLMMGTEYQYIVKSVFPNCYEFAEEYFTTLGKPVANLSGVESTNSIALSWGIPTGAEHATFIVERSGEAFNLPAGTTHFVDGDLLMGTEYNYCVVAVYPNREYTVCEPFTTTCSTITNLVGEESTNSITLSWNAPEGGDNATYRIYRDGTAKVMLPAGTTSYVDLGLLMGTSYEYCVEAVFPNCIVEPICGTFTTTCLPITGLESEASAESIALSWNAPAGGNNATYDVYRDDVLVAHALTTTSFNDEGLVRGTSYEYCVEALFDDCSVAPVCEIFETLCPTETYEFNAIACDSYTWNDVTYVRSGDYVQQFETIFGCDSIVTLHLTVNYSTTHEFSAVVCDEYTWNDVMYTESGDYVQEFETIHGCDSIVTLHLTVNYSTTHEFSAVVCDEYTWNDVTYTESGDYVQEFETIHGCDSIVTLHLTVNPSYNIDLYEVVCEEYAWNGTIYTESGDYTRRFVTVYGCDSIVTLHLTINHPVTNEFSAEVCGSYNWNGIIYTTSGDYVQTFDAANGCDSIVTLHLTIRQSVQVLTGQFVGGEVVLNWEAPDTDVTNYVVERDGEELATVDGSQRTYIDNTVEMGTYNYCVTAIYGDFHSIPACVDVSTGLLGDANGDGYVNILDVTTIIAYILEFDPPVFVFFNADVNGDGIINISDMAGCINIATGNKAASCEVANIEYQIVNGVLYMNNDAHVSAFQIALSDDNVKALAFDEYITSSAMTADGYVFIAYNMEGKVFEAGTHALLQVGDAEVNYFLATNACGDISEGRDGVFLGIEENNFSVAYPNPFSTFVTVNNNTNAEFVVTSISGQVVYRETTSTNFVWTPDNVESGVYFINVYVDGMIKQTSKIIYQK